MFQHNSNYCSKHNTTPTKLLLATIHNIPPPRPRHTPPHREHQRDGARWTAGSSGRTSAPGNLCFILIPSFNCCTSELEFLHTFNQPDVAQVWGLNTVLWGRSVSICNRWGPNSSISNGCNTLPCWRQFQRFRHLQASYSRSYRQFLNMRIYPKKTWPHMYTW